MTQEDDLRRQFPAWEPGSVVLAEFRVERSLGSGGFGRVELVTSIHSGQQYAVKRLLRPDPQQQFSLMTEARRWSGLPAHQNIVTCHFIRTIGSEFAIFTEYVAGGSLADLIASGALYSGENTALLGRILGIALQAAWGIAAAHHAGMLHLDIKPANVLIAEDGIAKITDFGLAAVAALPDQVMLELEAAADYIVGTELGTDAREAVKEILRSQLAAPKADETIEGQPGLNTLGYASPEQAEGRPVTQAADLWSWALTVLEMFVGDRTWPSGTLAPAVLEQMVSAPGRTRVPVPAFVRELLEKCFVEDPAQRPRRLDDAATALTHGAQASGLPVQGPPPGLPEPGGADVGDQVLYGRQLVSGRRWQDPRNWLGYAYETAGRDPREAVARWPSATGSLRSRALDELRALTEARAVLEPVAVAGAPAEQLGMLCIDIGGVQERLGDAMAARDSYQRAVNVLAVLGTDSARHRLIQALLALSIADRESGDRDRAVASARRALQLGYELAATTGSRDAIAPVLQSLANAVPDDSERIRLLQDAVAEYEQHDPGDGLIGALAGLASAFHRNGQSAEAKLTWQKVDALQGNVDMVGRPDRRAVRARILMNRATEVGFNDDGLGYALTAISEFTELLRVHGISELAEDLGHAHFFAAQVHEASQRPSEALAEYGRAASALEQATMRDGRTDLAHALAQAWDHGSTIARDLGQVPEAILLARQAVELWQRQAAADGPRAWRVERAEAYRKLAAVQVIAREMAAAADTVAAGLALFEEPVEQWGLPERRAVIQLYQEAAILARRTGDPGTAQQRLTAALDLVGDDNDQVSTSNRASLLLNLGNVFNDTGRYLDAVAVFQASAEESGRLENQLDGSRQRLDTCHHIANAWMKYGRYDLAADVAEEAITGYQEWIARGRADLTGELARMRAALATARFLHGDLSAAISSLELALPVLAASPREDARAAAQALTGQLEEWRALLAVEPGDVPDRARSLAVRYGGALEISRGGQVEGASHLLEHHLATGLRLAGVAPDAELVNLCGEIGLALNVTASYAGRQAAAEWGISTASNCFEAVYRGTSDPAVLDRWCDAQIGTLAMLPAGTEPSLVASELDRIDAQLREWDPAGLPARSSRVRSAVAELRRAASA